MGRPRLPPGQATTNAERCRKRLQKMKTDKGTKYEKHLKIDAARTAAKRKEVFIMMKALLLHLS